MELFCKTLEGYFCLVNDLYIYFYDWGFRRIHAQSLGAFLYYMQLLLE